MSDTTTTNTENTDDKQVPTPETSQGKPEGKTEPTFTQADIDRLMTKTRHEARDSVQKKLLEDLGLDSFDTLKSIISDAQKRKEAEMSETQKLQAQIEAMQKKVAEAEQRAKDEAEKRLGEQRRNIFEAAIASSGGNNPKRVYTLLQLEKPNDFLAVFGDDATADEGKLKALIKQVQADYPEYFGSKGAGSPSNANGDAPKAGEEAKRQVAQGISRIINNI